MKTRAVNNVFLLLCAACFAACLINSEAVAEQSRYYIRLCAVSVVPSLFVFSVLSGVLCASPAFYRLCSLPFFGAEAAVLLLGLLGGFPLGALIAVELYENGAVTKRQAQYLCAFTNNPSLSFVISFTGAVLGSKKAGLLLALLVFASSVTVGLVFRAFYLHKSERIIRISPLAAQSKGLPRVIKESSTTMLTVCGCIVFFGSISVLFPMAIARFFELSGGISACVGEVEAAVLLGFSGISVIMQVFAVCGGSISALPFTAAKILQGALMGIFAYFMFD